MRNSLSYILACVATLLFNLTFVSGQTCDLYENLAGRDVCCGVSSPISCLKNVLASINEDNGFYVNMPISRIHQLKAELNTQIALVYLNQTDFNSTVRYTNEALMHVETSILYEGKEEALKLRAMILELGRKACIQLSPADQIKCHCDEYDRKLIELKMLEPEQISIVGSSVEEKDLASVEKDKVILPQRVASTVKPEHVNQVLAALRKYMQKKPLDSRFIQMQQTDTCILQIDHFYRNDYQVKECSLVRSNHRYTCGERMMGLSNLMSFPENRDPLTFETVIVLRPGTKDACSYSNGIYYVEYFNERHLVEN